jgi:GT2 family glycosyltransferase
MEKYKIAEHIVAMFETLLEAEFEIYKYVKEKNKSKIIKMYQDSKLVLESIKTFSKQSDEKVYQELWVNCEDILYSFDNCLKRFSIDVTLHKIEYELIPLTRLAMVRFYFFAIVSLDPIQKENFYESEMMDLLKNPYLEESIESGDYKYDISITVVAYNKLKYTKMCVESLLKNLPPHLNCELILYNHGCDDGTKEYFESICPTKQIDIKVNGKIHCASLIIEGKYYMGISNDIIITKNSIKNLFDYMEANPEVAWAVPSTSNISNLQSIPAEYSSLDELDSFAEKNNMESLYRQEQRVRLCNPIDIKRTSVYYQNIRYLALSMIAEESLLFPDDRQSLLLRRSGYKMSLVKNAYCHHFGSVTLKDEIDNSEYYNKGRKWFASVYGVDPWGVGFCYDPELFQTLECTGEGSVFIMGINCGLGSNSLKIKEDIKENSFNLNVILHNYTNDICFLKDLKGVSDKAEYIHSINDLLNNVNILYDYILIDQPLINYEEEWEIIENLQNKLKNSGTFIINIISPSDILHNKIMKHKDVKRVGNWFYWKNNN